MSIFTLSIHDSVTKPNVDALLRGNALAIWLKGFIGKGHREHVYRRVSATPLEPLPIHYTREDGSAGYHPDANVARPGVDVQLDQYFDCWRP